MIATGLATENSRNRIGTRSHKVPGPAAKAVVASASLRGRRETRRAPIALLLAGLTAALTLPGSGGADPSLDAQALRAQNASIETQMHTALLNLYSLDARVTQARARVASLTTQADDVRKQRAQVRRERTIAGRAWRASVAALSRHLRTIYENGTPDAVAVLLGATSIDDAMTRLDELERTARINRDTIAQTQQARRDLTRLQLDLVRRAERLHALVASAQQTSAQLEQTRAQRSTYIARLANERTFNARKITQLDAQAQASAARTPAAATTSTRAASAPVAPDQVPAPSLASSGATLVVTATGYSLTGSTSTGLPTGWGVVAVDPSVIPLGTRLTVPGYGNGVAVDTGGGVHGAAIDLWFPSAAQAAAWGRRTVTIALH
jgi:3D (Asp-Asp-Asp) domain-containing protein